MLRPFQIGDGPRHLEDPGKGAGGEPEPVGDQFQHPVAAGIQFAMFPKMSGIHLGVAVDSGPLEAVVLEVAGAFHPAGYGGGTLRLASVGQVTVPDRRDLDVDVDPVHERPGDPGAVPLKHHRRAGALVIDIA